MSKTITAFFGPGQRSVKTDPLFQWDDGVILKFSGLNLPDTFAVDFSNSTSGGAKKRNTGNSEGVLVPAEVFTSGTEIYAWPVGTDEIGSHTEAVVVIPLDRRARPAGALPPGPQDDDARTIITEAVNAWMDAHAGEIGGGISEAIKNALLQLAEHVAYIDEHGHDYYDDLEAALNYVKELTAISAQFSQGEAVIYDTDTLDTLRRYLAVVAQYNDSTSELVTNYTLSGVLQSGTSSITAAYEGKTDSFDVTVTHYEADLSSITAVYTQSGVVCDTDTLTTVQSDLVVEAQYSDGSAQTVPSTDYTLTGAMTAGTNTYTVSYGGKTATFDVVVKHNYAEINLSNWTKANYDTIVLSQNQIKLVCENQSQISGWNAWVADCKKTLWSAVNGKTVKVRVKVSGDNFVEGTDSLFFGFGVYANSSVTSLGPNYAKRGGLFTVIPQNDANWYESTMICDIANFTMGSITPTAQSTFGVLCYSQSLKNAYITDVQLFEVDAE